MMEIEGTEKLLKYFSCGFPCANMNNHNDDKYIQFTQFRGKNHELQNHLQTQVPIWRRITLIEL
jgi:hypothetical protein